MRNGIRWRLCFIVYWLCAKLANEWRAKGEHGTLKIAGLKLQAPHASRS
jgi:hypothetical protein